MIILLMTVYDAFRDIVEEVSAIRFHWSFWINEINLFSRLDFICIYSLFDNFCKCYQIVFEYFLL